MSVNILNVSLSVHVCTLAHRNGLWLPCGNVN